MAHTQAQDEDPLAELRERLEGMRTQEAVHYAVPDYLAAAWQRELRDDAEDAGAAEEGESITEQWREKICEWCFEVVDHFDADREIVAVTMSFLDRYLATRAVDRRTFRLAAMAALYLALKLCHPGRLRLTALVELAGGYFTPEHLVAMESSMLRRLCWRVHPPTAAAFCSQLLPLVPLEVEPGARRAAGELTRFLTELAACDYWFVTKKPSAVAVAAMVNALELQGPCRIDPRDKVRFLQRLEHTGMAIANDPEILECCERLREMYMAGDYAPTFEEDADVRVDAVSPTGVTDGPYANEAEDGSEMECA